CGRTGNGRADDHALPRVAADPQRSETASDGRGPDMTPHRHGARVRILHVVDSLAAGGTELVAAALIERTESRFDHAVCSLRGSGPADNTVARLAVPVSFLGKRDGHDWGLALRIARLCRRLRPEVVHARNWGTIDAVIGARLAGVPVVIQSEHGRD